MAKILVLRRRQLRATFLLCAALFPLLAGAQAGTIRQYQFEPSADGQSYELVLKEVPRPAYASEQVLVRIHATALNGDLDVNMLEASPARRPGLAGGIPLSDGAGEVIAVGDAVTELRVGDRVAGTFFRRWVDGPRTDAVFASIRGGNDGGMLSEVVVADADSLVAIPGNLSYEEAATLPTAGLTAFNGLVKYGNVQTGDFVLLEGTGGVSSFGLVFAVAAGARAIVTSSSDAKLERAAGLGAFGTVNYRTNPEWQATVRDMTGGAGVTQVLEVGGQATLPKALEALAFNGHIALIGELSGFAEQISTGQLMQAGARLTAIFVGSRADFESMNAFIAEHDVHPVIGSVFDFEQAAEAFDLMANGDYMGKIVIRVGAPVDDNSGETRLINLGAIL